MSDDNASQQTTSQDQATSTGQTTQQETVPAFQQFDDGLISTVDRAIPPIGAKPAEKTGTEGEEVIKEPEIKTIPSTPSVSDLTPLQEILKTHTGILEGVKEVLSRPAAPTAQQPSQATQQTLPYKNVATMSNEEILDNFTNDPKGFYSNLASQVLHEVLGAVRQDLTARQEQTQQQTYEQQVAKTYEKYTNDNPDFEKMYKSGELQKFMDQNPGHTWISAHQALTGESRTKEAIEKAVAKAVAEAEKKFLANQQAKQGARVLSGSPAAGAAPHGVPDELKNPKKYGGTLSVLAARHAARLANTGN